jgi:hypothetical protein
MPVAQRADPTDPETPRSGGRAGLYVAVTVIALLVTVYLIFQLIGFVFKLLFFAAVVLIGFAALRAWARSSA